MALKEFDDIQRIEVLAVESGVESLAGELFVHPNSKNHRKEISEIVLVDCETDLTTSGTSAFGLNFSTTTIHRDRIGDEIAKSLNQALIDVKIISVEELNMTRSEEPDFYATYDTHPHPSTPQYDGQNFLDPTVQHNDLINMFTPGHFTEKQAVVFCINEYCINLNSMNRIDGEVKDIDKPIMILYKSGLYRSNSSNYNGTKVAPHEFIHGLGAFHSFSNYNDFTHRIYITDNIMDYEDSSIPPPTTRVSLFKYQWDIIKQSEIIKNEI